MLLPFVLYQGTASAVPDLRQNLTALAAAAPPQGLKALLLNAFLGARLKPCLDTIRPSAASGCYTAGEGPFIRTCSPR